MNEFSRVPGTSTEEHPSISEHPPPSCKSSHSTPSLCCVEVEMRECNKVKTLTLNTKETKDPKDLQAGGENPNASAGYH